MVGYKGSEPVSAPYTNDLYKHYIDFSAENGLEYSLIDGGWYGGNHDTTVSITKPIDGVDIAEVVRYAESRGVKILLWVNWYLLDKEMDQALPLYHKWGIAGIKIDYMNNDDQPTVEFYHRILEKAAEYNFIVDFHGAYKPTGIRRTWPNLITREGVRGLERSKWDGCSPEHDVTIPYTRMLAGPMDYTPGGFNNAFREEYRVRYTNPMTQGTRCHQLAMYVVYESPLQMLPDAPVNYYNGKGLEFIRAVPTVWDDTRFVDGEVADFIVLARKKGDKWYLGAMTDWDEREVTIPVSFLGEAVWKMKSWADGSSNDAQSVKTAERTVSANDTLTVKLESGGGFAAIFEPAK